MPKKGEKKGRAKRKPSKYNLHIARETKNGKSFAEAVESWKEKKTRSISKTRSKRVSKKKSGKLEDRILQNLVDLQKVHINLAERFDILSEQISNLLALFEASARSFAREPHTQMTRKDKEFLDKIDRLLEQNKTIAKGLTLMEQKMRERLYGPIVPQAGDIERRGPPKL